MTLRRHPREQIVDTARSALLEALMEWNRGPGAELTGAEFVSVVSHELSNQLTIWAKYEIRLERHGDAGKPGGLE